MFDQLFLKSLKANFKKTSDFKIFFVEGWNGAFKIDLIIDTPPKL